MSLVELYANWSVALVNGIGQVWHNLHDGISGNMGFYCPLLAKVMAYQKVLRSNDDSRNLHDGITGCLLSFANGYTLPIKGC